MKNIKKVFIYFLFILVFSFSCQTAFALEQVNLNTATIEQLVQLKGIGEKTAQKIIEYRNLHPFTSVDEFTKIKGVGEKLLEKLRDQLTVGEKKKK
jgi:competence protein ComEA